MERLKDAETGRKVKVAWLTAQALFSATQVAIDVIVLAHMLIVSLAFCFLFHCKCWDLAG